MSAPHQSRPTTPYQAPDPDHLYLVRLCDAEHDHYQLRVFAESRHTIYILSFIDNTCIRSSDITTDDLFFNPDLEAETPYFPVTPTYDPTHFHRTVVQIILDQLEDAGITYFHFETDQP